MPTGWASAPNPKGNSSSTNQICSGKLENSLGGEATQKTAQQVTFENATSTLLPTELDEVIGYDPSASSDFAKDQSVLDSCHSTSETSDGETIHFTLGQMSFPTLGDQSGAWLLSGSVSIISVSAPIVLVRKGNYVVLLTVIGSGPSQATALEGIAKTAIGKVA
jgi:hypothetical protein